VGSSSPPTRQRPSRWRCTSHRSETSCDVAHDEKQHPMFVGRFSTIALGTVAAAALGSRPARAPAPSCLTLRHRTRTGGDSRSPVARRAATSRAGTASTPRRRRRPFGSLMFAGTPG
jgi:hypothetical protein